MMMSLATVVPQNEPKAQTERNVSMTSEMKAQSSQRKRFRTVGKLVEYGDKVGQQNSNERASNQKQRMYASCILDKSRVEAEFTGK